jgi:hypothetical protein
LEEDCFQVNKRSSFHKPINVYFYDGGHLEWEQKAAFTFYDSVFDDVFIAVVDDWNWKEVRNGTLAAFEELGYRILFSKEFYTKDNCDTSSWWNGMYIAVIEKSRPQ